jgi:hypothetical protein
VRLVALLVHRAYAKYGVDSMRSILLWAIGVPIPIIILIWLLT